jgi:tetratricopeptide (TPR) repeat protein
MINKLEHQKIEQLLLVNLANTKSSLKIAVAWFTNPNLFDMVLQLVHNKIDVTVILSNEEINFVNPKINYDDFIAAGGKLFVGNSLRLMHNKFSIIDNKYLVNGSYNWTIKAEKSNFENVVLTDNLNLVSDFNLYFEFLQQNTNAISKVAVVKTTQSISNEEKEEELNLIEKVTLIALPNKIVTEETEYSEELNNELDKVELLYLNLKHQECISYANLMLKKYKDIPEFYYWIAISNWRLNNFKEQISNAQKAIDIDNHYFDVYNLLGMGYSSLGQHQLSILNYDNCIVSNPNEYAYYRNRAIALKELQNIENLPKANKISYQKKEIADLKTMLDIINTITAENVSYNDLESKAFANYYLGNSKEAKEAITLALEKYNAINNKFLKDKNILKDIKELQKQIVSS